MYFDVLTCAIDRWTSIWGDPILPATVMMTGYAVAAYFAWLVVRRETGRERMLWGLGMALMLFLFINTHLDLHVLPGAFGRCLAKAQGWWENRRTVQMIFILCVVAAMVLTLVFVVVFFFQNLLSNLLLTCGCLVSAGYLVIKGSGFHQTDHISNLTVGTIPVSVLSEVLGAVMISAGALLKLDDMKRAELGKPTLARKTYLLLRGPLLGDLYAGPNNFKLIRMVAALLVMLSHAYVLSYGLEINGRDPISLFIGTRFGNMTLAIFFTLSGFILASRFGPETRALDWWVSRVLRIFPALLLVLVLSAYVLGPLMTSLPVAEYFLMPATHTYVPANASLFFLQRSLPGVFTDNIHPDIVNASLWMLQYMMMCYVLLFVLGCLGVFYSKTRITVFLVIFCLIGLLMRSHVSFMPVQPLLSGWLPLLLPFVIGMAIFVWRDDIPMSPVVALGFLCLCILTRELPLHKFVVLITVIYASVFIAYGLKGPILQYNKIGDYSYGTYLFGFPVQQCCIAVLGPMSPAENMGFAVPVTVLLAVLSYHFVEAPTLRLKRRVGRRATRLSI